MNEEGIIRFHCHWKPSGPVLPQTLLPMVNRWRSLLRSMELLGVSPEGVGFGNISLRSKGRGLFYITGTGTGHLEELGTEHFALAEECLPEKNRLTCSGPVRASSESMSHAAVYESLPEVQAVVHIHQMEYWEKLRGRIPTTPEYAEYGTPGMVLEIIKLLKDKNMAASRLLVMGGHPEGMIAYGNSLEEAVIYLLAYFNTVA